MNLRRIPSNKINLRKSFKISRKCIVIPFNEKQTFFFRCNKIQQRLNVNTWPDICYIFYSANTHIALKNHIRNCGFWSYLCFVLLYTYTVSGYVIRSIYIIIREWKLECIKMDISYNERNSAGIFVPVYFIDLVCVLFKFVIQIHR